MNKILRITLGSLGLLIVILILIYLVVKDIPENSGQPSTLVTPVIVGTAAPYPTRTPITPAPSSAPSAERTVDPASGTNLPKYTVPASYSNLTTPEDTPGESNG